MTIVFHPKRSEVLLPDGSKELRSEIDPFPGTGRAGIRAPSQARPGPPPQFIQLGAHPPWRGPLPATSILRQGDRALDVGSDDLESIAGSEPGGGPSEKLLAFGRTLPELLLERVGIVHAVVGRQEAEEDNVRLVPTAYLRDRKSTRLNSSH